MSEVDPKKPIYDLTEKQRWWPCAARFGTLVAIVGTVATLWCQLSPVTVQTQAKLLGLVAAWAICAPLWFFVEFHCFYRKTAGEGSWELFKHGQQLAVAVWAGLTASLYAVASSDIAKPPRTTEECAVFVVIKGSEPTIGTKFVKCPK